MTKSKLTGFIILLIALGVGLLANELGTFYLGRPFLIYPKPFLVLIIIWLILIGLYLRQIKISRLIFFSFIAISLIVVMMYSPVTAGFLAGNGLLIWLLYKLKFKKITFIAKLCIDLGLLMAGIAIFLTGISMLKSKIVPDEVSILWVIAGVSFGIGIILTAITKPERALKIGMIVTASIGSVFTIYYLFLIFSSAVSGRFEFNAIWSMFIALSVTVVFIGLELLLYRFRRSKFAWLWLVTIFVGGIFTGLGVGTGIILCLIGIALLPHWRDLYRYLFPKWVRIPYVEINPKSKVQNPKFKIDSGFTLIELLIVIAIIAIVSVGLISSFGFAIWGIKHSELQTQAVYLAQSEMEYLRSIPYSELNDGTYTQLKSIKPNPILESKALVKIDSVTDGLKKIIVRVIWYEGNQQKQIEFITLITQK